MKKGYTDILTLKTVTIGGEMVLPGKMCTVKTKLANYLIDNDAAKKVVEVVEVKKIDSDELTEEKEG